MLEILLKKFDNMQHTIIIAEAGVNHNGSLQTAKKLIDVAAAAGVDFIKFQTYNTENLLTKSSPKAPYQILETGEKESQYEMLKKLELSKEHHYTIKEYCNSKHIQFLSTPFDIESINFLAKLQPILWKIPSGEITNVPYLQKIASHKQPIIMSTGMCTMHDIENALHILTSQGISKEFITLLHCTTEYPTPFEEVNLRAMQSIAEKFGVSVGYSDHTRGIEVAIAAVALGARVIEKHITLDKTMEGPDHAASIEPHELHAMVKAIRNIEIALGSSLKTVTPSEQRNKDVARKSIVASQFIQKNDIFTEKNITIKRPGTGISPMKWNEVIGKRASQDFNPDELIIL